MSAEKIADLFPGQGFKPEELLKTAKELSNSIRAKNVFNASDKVLGEIFSSGKTFRQVLDNPDEQDLSEMTETENAQPIVLTVSAAAVEAFNGSLPDTVSGHSAGLIGGIWRAGSLGIDDAIWLSRKRGETMRDVRLKREAGAMAAVMNREPIDQAKLWSIVGPFGVELVNLNSPGQIVVSGEKDAIEKAGEEIKRIGLRATLLPTSDAFHHPKLLGPAVEIFDKHVKSVGLKDPEIPIYMNSTAEPVVSASELEHLLAKEIAKPVDWINVIKNMQRDGVSLFREFGHGNVLTTLVSRIDPQAKTENY